jgi:hypothetical protein
MKFNLTFRGTTLVEIILYFTILSVFLFAAMSFALQILSASQVSGNVSEFETNIDFVTQEITEAILAADSVNDAGSTFDNDTGVLSLNMNSVPVSPTVISLSGGNVSLTEGSSDPVLLNSGNVSFSQLRFHKRSFAKSPDQIVIDGLVGAISTDLASGQHTLSFHLSISLRSL